jgi:hypothetical protein
MSRRYTSPIRWEKVIEGRATIADMDGATPLEKLYKLDIDRKTIDEALSLRERSLILFPDEVLSVATSTTSSGGVTRTNKQKVPIPTQDALNKTRNYMSMFRVWDKNRGVVVWGVRDPINRYWLYYNVQYIKDFREAQQRVESIVSSLSERLKIAIESIELPKKEKQKLARQVLQEISDKILNKKQRKKREKEKGE